MGKLGENIINQETQEGSFLLKKEIKAIKYDFIRALNEIVEESVKTVYSKKKDDVFMLFEKFTNYFTLNYDPFLYLFLMRSHKKDCIVFPPTQESKKQSAQSSFPGTDSEKSLYSMVKDIKEKGKITLDIEGEKLPHELKPIKLSKVTKVDLLTIASLFLKGKYKKKKDLEECVNSVLEESESSKKKLRVDDGCREKNGKLICGQQLFPEEPNLIFLHGACHLFNNENGDVEKIKANQGKAFNKILCQRLEEGKDIVCVLKNTSEGKLNQIESNKYLDESYKRLSKIKGNMVILGSALNENDNHIFSAINENKDIEKVYISTSEREKKDYYEKGNNYFSNKETILFDYNTIKWDQCVKD